MSPLAMLIGGFIGVTIGISSFLLLRYLQNGIFHKKNLFSHFLEKEEDYWARIKPKYIGVSWAAQVTHILWVILDCILTFLAGWLTICGIILIIVSIAAFIKGN